MPNYQNAKIYKLICSETNRVYIGSTVSTLPQRKSQHKAPGNHCCSKDFINPEIILLENFPCNSKSELLIKEREYIENTDCVNLKLPCRTEKEWKEYNKERRNKYYKNNKEELNKKKKEYREKNKEYYNGYMKEYREKNKEEINKKRREQFDCKCGGSFTPGHRARHFRTKKHQIYTIKNLI
jgi:hypothetical protein